MPPETLWRRVVPPVLLAAHGAEHRIAHRAFWSLPAQYWLPQSDLHDQAWRGPAPEVRHVHRVNDEAGLDVLLQAPDYDLRDVQVEHDYQVQPALMGGDLGEVRGSNLVGTLGREAAPQQVGRKGLVVRDVGGDSKLSLAHALDAVLLHELLHPQLAYSNPPCKQLMPHPGPAAFTLDLSADGPDKHQQGFATDARVGRQAAGLVFALASPVL